MRHETLIVGMRNPWLAARSAPSNAYAFTYHDIVMTTVLVDGRETTVRSEPINVSGRYFIDGERFNVHQIAALPGDHRVLLDNVRSNGWTHVVRCRAGNFQPFEDGDQIIRTKEQVPVMEERHITPPMQRLMQMAADATRHQRNAEVERDRLKAANERLLQRVQRVSALCVAAELENVDYLTVAAVFAALLEGAP